MTAIVASPSIERGGFSPRTIRMTEAVVIPVGALVASALLFSIFLLVLGKSPIDFFGLIWTGGFGSSFSIQNTLQRAAPLILTGLAFAIPGAHRAHHDRRRRRAGARRLRRRGDRHPAGQRRRAADHRPADHGARRPWLVGAALDRPRRLAAPLSRRQRDDLLAAAQLHRHRDHELLRRGRAARSRPPRTSRRPCRSATPIASARSPAPTCIGALPRASCLPSCSIS